MKGGCSANTPLLRYRNCVHRAIHYRDGLLPSIRDRDAGPVQPADKAGSPASEFARLTAPEVTLRSGLELLDNRAREGLSRQPLFTVSHVRCESKLDHSYPVNGPGQRFDRRADMTTWRRGQLKMGMFGVARTGS
jgi:hypothetical protein